MSSTQRDVSSPGASTNDPVVASVAGLRLRWHARALRGDRSLAEAARLVRLNRDELSRIERGETTQIRFETLAKLLVGYGCGLDDLLEVEPKDNETVAAPLYTGVLAALGDRSTSVRPPARRAVRRSVDADILPEDDEARFAPSAPKRSTRRRPPPGTLNRAG